MSARTKCNDCGSSDGLAMYENGTYCFSCNKSTHYKNLIHSSVNIPTYKTLPKEIDNVYDFNDFPKEVQEYLLKFFTKDNLPTCFYNDKYKRLFFSCFQYEGYWGRNMDNKVYPYGMKKAKWLYLGIPKNEYSWIELFSFLPTKTVCIVEDIISAIKVSEIMDCICLGGTTLSDINKLTILQYKQLLIFLDPDEAGRKAALNICKQLKLHIPICIIRSRRDPKEYDIKELKLLLLINREKI